MSWLRVLFSLEPINIMVLFSQGSGIVIVDLTALWQNDHYCYGWEGIIQSRIMYLIDDLTALWQNDHYCHGWEGIIQSRIRYRHSRSDGTSLDSSLLYYIVSGVVTVCRIHIDCSTHIEASYRNGHTGEQDCLEIVTLWFMIMSRWSLSK